MKKKKNAAQSGQMSLESLLEQKEGQQTLLLHHLVMAYVAAIGLAADVLAKLRQEQSRGVCERRTQNGQRCWPS